MPSFPITTVLRLDWSELDIFGHINNVAYFKYMQASRITYWERVGLSAIDGTEGIGPMLASTKCDFKKPLHYPGNITVQASIVHTGRTSFQIHHRVLDNAGALCAEGFDVVVLFDYTTSSKVEIPDALRRAIQQIEGADSEKR